MAKTREPRIPTKPVRLEVFDIQGHNGGSALDYEAFFRFIQSEPAAERREKIADRIVAVPSFEKQGDEFLFVAYSGSSDTSFLVLDLTNDSEEIRHIEEGKMIATRTVGIIDPKNRRAVIQYVHTGVRAPQIAGLLEKLGQLRSPEFEGLTLEFAPLPGQTFASEIARFERIQSASATLTKPNSDWDDFSNAANNLADNSGAQNISVTATAARGRGLEKSKGFVQDIVALTSRAGRSIIKAASIKGFREGESALTTLNLNKHIEAKNVAIPITRDGLPNPTGIAAAAKELLDSTPLPALAAEATPDATS